MTRNVTKAFLLLLLISMIVVAVSGCTTSPAATPTPAQQKAREWLPDAMRFPAVDPDASTEPQEAEDEESVPWEDAA